MPLSPVDIQDGLKSEAFAPSEEEQKFISGVSTRFLEMWNLKNQALPILDHRTLSEYINDSVTDYAVIMDEQQDKNDPVKPYVTSVSRNKTDAFVYNLSKGLMFPSVTAQNGAQEIDRVWARVGRGLLEWAHRNDGFPDENGQIKSTRYIHTMSVEGTTHVLDIVTKDGLYSENIPNDEVFIPNFWQTSLQKQPRFYRAKLNVTYEEARDMFGQLKKFKYVSKGDYGLLFSSNDVMQAQWQGIVQSDRVQILYVWEKMSPEQLQKEKDAGRVKKSAKQHYYYNVIINGVPMFKVDNILPWRDGYLNVSVGRFSFFAKSGFYWGESAPNKFRYDKHWRDGWMTLLRHKGKLNALRPQFSLNGNYVGDEIYVPANVINLQEDPELKTIEGVGDPINNSDLELMRMADREIDNSSVSNTVQGQQANQKMTAREAVITQSNAQVALDAFSQQVAALVHARTIPILLRLCEKIPKGDFKKLVVPEQTLSDGTRGNLEIVFKSLKNPKEDGYEEEYRTESIKMWEDMTKAKNMGEPHEKMFINTRQLDDITFYLKSDVATFSSNYDMIRKEQFNERAQSIYLMRPDLFDQRETGRQLLQVNEDDDSLLAEEQQPQQQGQPQQGQGQPLPESPNTASLGALAPMTQ